MATHVTDTDLLIWAVSCLLVGAVAGAVLTCLCMRRHIKKAVAATELRAKKEAADKMQERKYQFFANVSNELRTRMALIVSPLQAMTGESLTGDVKQRLQMILSNAQMLLHEINMLIDPRHLDKIGRQTPKPLGDTTADKPTPQVVYEPLSMQKVQTDTAAQEAEQTATQPEQKATAIDDSNAAEAAQLDDEELLAEEKAANHPFTILMVDDSADMCRFVRDYFRGEYNIVTASDGEQALLQLEENDGIDLVVSDVTMPKMDGMELCRRVKTDLRWSHIPVILLTGRTGEQAEVQGLKLGADDYITKPFNAEMLRLRVKKLIEVKESRQKQFKEKIDVSPSEITITSVDEDFIQRAIKICEEHISDTEFSVEVLGQELAMSRTYLYRKLMNITGKGPAEFIRVIRMKRAKQYLEQSRMPIAEVSAAVGYSTPKRFTENFKTEYGTSPSEYIKKFRASSSN
ncbi:MAG: response regulator [Prevotellaceae bacterium]|nr:response regulator [Prevotellaceae bacterium]